MTLAEDQQTLAALRTMLDRAHLATPGQLPEAILDAARELGWVAQTYLVDYEQRVLLSVPVPGLADGGPEAVEGSDAGRCFRNVEPVRWSSGQDTCAWLPILDGTDRLGVLRITVPLGTDLGSTVFTDRCRLLAHLAGHLIGPATASLPTPSTTAWWTTPPTSRCSTPPGTTSAAP